MYIRALLQLARGPVDEVTFGSYSLKLSTERFTMEIRREP